MKRCFVGLGTNLGDRLVLLRAAAEGLAATPGARRLSGSGIWETHPLGPGSGPYLNAAVELRYAHEPERLLERLAAIEDELGRVRRARWGDRRIDLDLLCAFDPRGTELVRASERLSLPHPCVHERDFVLQPLVDLDPELRVAGRGCAESLARIGVAERTLIGRLDTPLLASIGVLE